MKRILIALGVFALCCMPAAAQVNVNVGKATVRVLYNGQPLPGGCALYFAVGPYGLGCGGTTADIPIGNYTVTELHNYPFPQQTIAVNTGQTTVVDVETSPYVGLITGVVSVNGQPPAGNGFVTTYQQDGASGTDGTGRFRLFALQGAGTVQVLLSGTPQATRTFTAVAGSEVDIGTIAINTGRAQVRVLYNGQPLPGACSLYFAVGPYGLGCGATTSDIPTGSYTVEELHGYPFPAQQVIVTAGQTAVVDVETSPYVGLVTGTVTVNGTRSTGAFVRTTQEDGGSGTDSTGRFRFVALNGPSTAMALISGNPLATKPFTAVAGTTTDIGDIAINTGRANVRVLYKGQPFPGACSLYFSLGQYGIGCGGTTGEIPAGTYTVSELHGYPFPNQSITVSAGQTTNVDVEISPYVGIMTGTISINGVPSNQVFVRTFQEDGGSGTDNTGRFRFFALAGPGVGMVLKSGIPLTQFRFNAVAGQVRDLGSIGSTTVKPTTVSKSSGLPNKTWTVRLTNTGANAAADAQLTGASFVQTFGAACPTPVVTSSLPLTSGLLAPGTSADVGLQINFGSCEANTRFTVTYTTNANGGTAPFSQPFTLQLP